MVVREKQAAALLDEAREQVRLFVDQLLRVAVVAHGDRQMHPGTARDEVRRVHHGAIGAGDLGQHQARRMPLGKPELVVRTERIRTMTFDDFEPAALFEQRRELRNERSAVPCVRMLGALPGVPAHHEGRVWEQEPHGLFRLVRREQPPRVIEMKVGQNDAIDILVGKARLLQAVEQDMALLLDTKTIAKLRGEERTNPGFKEDSALAVFDQQRPARKRNSIALVGLDPLVPERARRVSEHRTSVETLRVAENRPGPALRHAASLSG